MDTTIAIPNILPHYTNEQFRQPQTVYIAEGYQLKKDGYVNGAEYNYSDRLSQWDFSAHERGCDLAKLEGHTAWSADYIESYLRHYFDNPSVKLVHVLAGFNWATGFPYQWYGYITTED